MQDERGKVRGLIGRVRAVGKKIAVEDVGRGVRGLNGGLRAKGCR